MEDQEHTEQTPEEEKDVEAHSAKQSAKQAPAAARNDEGDDVEAHSAKQSATYSQKF